MATARIFPEGKRQGFRLRIKLIAVSNIVGNMDEAVAYLYGNLRIRRLPRTLNVKHIVVAEPTLPCKQAENGNNNP